MKYHLYSRRGFTIYSDIVHMTMPMKVPLLSSTAEILIRFFTFVLIQSELAAEM